MQRLTQTRIGRTFLLALAAALGLALLEGLARLIEPSPLYFHNRIFRELSPNEAARFRALLSHEIEGFEATYQLSAARVLDTDNFVLDRRLVYRLAPNLNLDALNFTLTPIRREEHRWHYNSNSEGWRGPLLEEVRAASGRLLALGDSTTYGWGLEEAESWPAQSAALLGGGWRAANRAVPGYSTFQGSLLLPEVLKQLRPQVVTLGFGANDAMPYPMREEELAGTLDSRLNRARSLLEHSALPRLLARLLASVGVGMRAKDFTRRVPPDEYERRLSRMIDEIRAQDAAPILLSICVDQADYRQILARIAASKRVPLLSWKDRDAAAPSWYSSSGFGDVAALTEHTAALAQAAQAREKTRTLTGKEDTTFFADACHPTPWGALLIADTLAQRVAKPDLERTSVMSAHRFSLEHTFRRPDARSDGKPPLLIALHGIGSNMQDLIGLQPHLDPRFFIVAAQAPYPYAIPGGYSWFALEITPEGVRIDLEQLYESRDKIIRFIGEATEAYGTDPQRVYLLGFSQGTMMSYAVLGKAPEKLAGIVAMSGRFIPDLIPSGSAAKNLKGFPLFVVHGTMDEVLPVRNGQLSHEALQTLPVEVSYKEYPMGHEVSRESIQDVREWLTEQLNR